MLRAWEYREQMFSWKTSVNALHQCPGCYTHNNFGTFNQNSIQRNSHLLPSWNIHTVSAQTAALDWYLNSAHQHLELLNRNQPKTSLKSSHKGCHHKVGSVEQPCLVFGSLLQVCERLMLPSRWHHSNLFLCLPLLQCLELREEFSKLLGTKVWLAEFWECVVADNFFLKSTKA